MRKNPKEIRIKGAKMQYCFESIERDKRFLIQMKIPFTVELSNYTCRIIAKNFDNHYIHKSNSEQFFIAGNLVKNDCKNFKAPTVKFPIQFFSYNQNFKYSTGTVYNIDLTAAYATILYNDGFLTDKTFKFLQKIPKPDRLGAVGMLASKKDVYYFEGGKRFPFFSEKNESPLQNFFWYACQKTFEAMQGAAWLFRQHFIFAWVDGIYVLDETGKIAKQIQNYFEGLGLASKIIELQNFEILETDTNSLFKYISNGKNKFINIPKSLNNLRSRVASNIIYEILNQSK